jgi:hypothetical protein
MTQHVSRITVNHGNTPKLKPALLLHVALSSQDNKEAPLMVCQYCKKDVDTPCHTMEEVQRRASDHVERCERALNRQKDASQGQSGGNI